MFIKMIVTYVLNQKHLKTVMKEAVKAADKEKCEQISGDHIKKALNGAYRDTKKQMLDINFVIYV